MGVDQTRQQSLLAKIDTTVPELRVLIWSNFPTSTIRSPEIATAPFSTGGPSIVAMARARTIIPLLQLSGMRPPKDCTVPGKEAEL